MYAWCTSKKHDKQIQQLSYDEAQGGLMLGCISGFNDILTNGSVMGQGPRLVEEKGPQWIIPLLTWDVSRFFFIFLKYLLKNRVHNEYFLWDISWIFFYISRISFGEKGPQWIIHFLGILFIYLIFIFEHFLGYFLEYFVCISWIFWKKWIIHFLGIFLESFIFIS